MPHLRAIEAQDGKASARLTDINGTPATIVIAGAADQLEYPIGSTQQPWACTTTSTNQIK
jgi:hypothetical protein